MKKPEIYRRSWWCWGWVWLILFPLTGAVYGDEFPDGGSIVFTAESKKGPPESSTLSPANDHTQQEGSPVIGGGVRKPPDIGAAGTASSTPPLRTESPTDEPAILPDVSPVPRHPLDRDKSPDANGQPFGQPDQFKRKQE